MAEILNFSFEDNFDDWTVVNGTGTWSIQNTPIYDGVKCARYTGVSGQSHGQLNSDDIVPAYPGQVITATGHCARDTHGSAESAALLALEWFNAADVSLGFSEGPLLSGDTAGQYQTATVTGTGPANAAKVRVQIRATANDVGSVNWDAITWDYGYDIAVVLTSPVTGAIYDETATIPLTVSITGDEPPPVSVAYVFDNGVDPPVTVGTSTVSPYSYNVSGLAPDTYDVTAQMTVEGGSVITSAAVSITITATPPPPTLREFKASNAYTYLVSQNFVGLASQMPLTAQVLGVEVVVDYTIQTLTRAKDIDVDDPVGANPDVLFDIIDGGLAEITLMSVDDGSFTQTGGAITEPVTLERSDFDIVEQGTSEDKKWVVLESSASAQITIGGEDSLFGLPPIAASDFMERALGFRFYPVLGTKPAYADSGDACIRFFINKLRLRVYFDAGSAEYYFASDDKTQVIKGELVHSYVEDGDFETSDASGSLQLKPELEIVDGTQTWIGDDWTIHAAYPPTDANQIGTVDERAEADGIGMSYNGLPSQASILDNRSRYMFITANFFADRDLDSIYGAHGLPRAFAYNGDFFYKIYTQPDPEKDMPRHVAYHHGHLALGYDEGRVDISVIGEPYNFNGAEGASSWSIGDKVVGLLPLSGTILGVFGSQSVWGISGTTVDNFATQVISPNVGAIEYTIADMGFPVYANAYGIYTLAQTQEYGDYLGTPMSQDVSPWLRPRLKRKYTSDKEVVVAWPVRAKNQYRLAFSDGYILSMTLNAGQQTAPTFSKQQYTLYDESDE